MQHTLKIAFAASALALAAQASAQITFYEADGFRGRAFTAVKPVRNFSNQGFNDRASSVVVDSGRWEVCANSDFGGACRVLRRGSYASLSDIGLNDRVSSVRPVANRRKYDNEAEPAMATPNYEYRRRPNEAVFQVPVTSVRAVMGANTERCWVERQQVSEPRRDEPSVGRGILGAVLGGVIGHQIGGGRGQDIATAGGAVLGGAIGANSGRDKGNQTVERDVRRCENTASGTPSYWDVGYEFRRVQHHVQMSAAPGPTITVNGRGEPRQ